MRAVFNGVVLAESDETVVVEGNHYFPPASVSAEYFTSTEFSTRCPWKGDASYYDITVGDEKAQNAAWFYESPSEKAANIKDRVAFYPVVQVA
jgi:uncharacterized protein (DUF427 family)